MDHSITAPPVGKDAVSTELPTPTSIITDEALKMEDGLGHEAVADSAEELDNESPTVDSTRHDSVIEEDADELEAPPIASENVEPRDSATNLATQGEPSFPTEPKTADICEPSTEKKLDLGSSMLKTPSVTASSKASPTLSHKSSASFSSAIFRTPPASHAYAPLPKWAGSIWVTKYGDKPWPVVLCDEETTPKKFMDSRRKDSHLPAILLGQRVYIWTVDSNLEPFIRDGDYLQGSPQVATDDVMSENSKEDQLEKLRQRAFRTDAMLGNDHFFWKNALKHDAQERRLRRKMGPVKRRAVSNSNKYVKREDNGSAKRKREDEGSERKAKRTKVVEERSSLQARASDESGTESGDDMFVASRKKHRSSPENQEGEEPCPPRRRTPTQDEIQANYKQDLQGRKGICTILVGEGDHVTPFKVPNKAISQSVVLGALIHYADEKKNDSYIKLDEAHKIEARTFEPVAAWLNKGSISPHLIKGRKGRAVLEGVHTKEDATNAAKLLASVYYTAARLQLSALQMHCVDKLHYLPATTSLGLIWATTYFNGAKVHGWASEITMEEWLVSRIALIFWDMVAEEGYGLKTVLKNNTHLRMSVMDRVAGIHKLVEEDEEEEWEEDWKSE